MNFIIDSILDTTASVVRTPMEVLVTHSIDNLQLDLKNEIKNLTYMAYFHQWGVIRYQAIMIPGITGFFSAGRSVHAQFALGL